MCGRYKRRTDKQRIAEAFHLVNLDGLALELVPEPGDWRKLPAHELLRIDRRN